jgi:hypothetical protein
MSIYRYIYLTILSVYKRFSRDPQINIFAVGFFSILVFFKIISIWGIYKYYALQQYELSPIFMIITGATVFLFNTFYFLFDSNRQEEYYKKFNKQKNKYGSIAVAIYVVIVFTFMIWVATKLREKNLEKKQQTTEIIQKARYRRACEDFCVTDHKDALSDLKNAIFVTKLELFQSVCPG